MTHHLDRGSQRKFTLGLSTRYAERLSETGIAIVVVWHLVRFIALWLRNVHL
jgi:hypothetical protein